MSLRVFHIVFVTVCVLLSAWVAVWGLRIYMYTKNLRALGLGIVFAICGFVLVDYGRRVYRKLKDLP